jgi:hypothetical protein
VALKAKGALMAEGFDKAMDLVKNAIQMEAGFGIEADEDDDNEDIVSMQLEEFEKRFEEFKAQGQKIIEGFC